MNQNPKPVVGPLFADAKGPGIERSMIELWESESPYAAGYWKAWTLVKPGLKHESNHSLLYPLVLLFRHYVELACKEIIKNGCPDSTAKTKHALKLSWATAKPIIVREVSDASQQNLADVEKLIMEMHHYDPKGDAARYDTDRIGNPTLQHLPDRIDCEKMLHNMDRVHTFLSDWNYKVRRSCCRGE